MADFMNIPLRAGEYDKFEIRNSSFSQKCRFTREIAKHFGKNCTQKIAIENRT